MPTNEDQPTVRRLIAVQRRLTKSKNPFIRHIGTLLAAGVLDRQMDALNDRQIAQLIIDEIERDLGIAQPEATICRQTAHRLIRSSGGKLTEEDIAKQQERPPCPKCGNEMLFRYGIDGTDYWECVSLPCALKIEEPNKWSR